MADHLSADWLYEARISRRLDAYAEWTDRQGEGAIVSRARVVGNRRIERIIAEREVRAARMSLHLLRRERHG